MGHSAGTHNNLLEDVRLFRRIAALLFILVGFTALECYFLRRKDLMAGRAAFLRHSFFGWMSVPMLLNASSYSVFFNF